MKLYQRSNTIRGFWGDYSLYCFTVRVEGWYRRSEPVNLIKELE